MANKLIENMDGEIWKKFVGLCKIDNVIVGEELTKLLSRRLKNRGIKI